MPVVRREKSNISPRPTRSASLEDILRDASCFGANEEVPTGLAHRALAREIAAQAEKERVSPGRPNRKRSVALWFSGLSAGTLAGASAAILVLAHLNGSVFQISPEAASLSAPALQEDEADTIPAPAVELPPVHKELPPPRLQKTAISSASLMTVTKPAVQAEKARFSAAQIAQYKEPSRPVRAARIREQAPIRTVRLSRGALSVSSASQHRAQPPVAQWKTEPFEETEYQLVTAAYETLPASGNYPSRSDHIQLTPVRMRQGYEPTGAEPLATASVPQF